MNDVGFYIAREGKEKGNLERVAKEQMAKGP